MRKHDRLPMGLAALGATAVLGMGASFAIGDTTNKTNNVRTALAGNKPKNVIFFLGDGMGTQEITAARYYSVGAAGRLNIDRLPFTGFDRTWSVKPDGTTPDYVPDSAATGTEWATGKKTIDDRDSQGPSAANAVGDNAGYKTVLEYAQEAGKKVGNVTTADLTDATPAVLAAHISNRNCSGPDNMVAGPSATPKCVSEGKQNGGLGSIAEQEVDHKMDVAPAAASRASSRRSTPGPTAARP